MLMIVDKVWKLTNTVRVGLDARSSHAQRQSTFPDDVSFSPPCHGVSHYENLTVFLFFWNLFAHPYIFTFLCVSHTNTLEVLLNLLHHIPGPSLPTIKLVDKRSLLIRSC
jgi:hypothetical protein